MKYDSVLNYLGEDYSPIARSKASIPTNYEPEDLLKNSRSANSVHILSAKNHKVFTIDNLLSKVISKIKGDNIPDSIKIGDTSINIKSVLTKMVGQKQKNTNGKQRIFTVTDKKDGTSVQFLIADSIWMQDIISGSSDVIIEPIDIYYNNKYYDSIIVAHNAWYINSYSHDELEKNILELESVYEHAFKKQIDFSKFLTHDELENLKKLGSVIEKDESEYNTGLKTKVTNRIKNGEELVTRD